MNALTVLRLVKNHAHAAAAAGSKQRDRRNRLAYTVVWSPLPPITWLIPFIGHVGICDSNGVASDFRGPYYVGDDGRMAFGAPTRALKMVVDGNHISSGRWDSAVHAANDEYQGHMHNICCDNCHSHVSYALNQMEAEAYGVRRWNMINLCFVVFFRANFLSWGGFFKQFLPFGLLLLLLLLLR